MRTSLDTSHLSDRELTDRIFGIGHPQQPVNIACRELEKKNIIRRTLRPIKNDLINTNIKTLHYTESIKHNTNASTAGLNEEEIKWIIEIKGCGSHNAMRVNYFLSIIGELLQRMDDPNAKYSIALPDMKQFRNLWNRFPKLAKERTQISAMFVSTDGSILEEN